MRRLHSRRASLTLAVLASVALIGAFPVTAAAGTTVRWVDDDGYAGPSSCGGSATAATHVQAAIDASSANDTVLVCPGKYVELVSITGKPGLHLIGAQPWKATIKAPPLAATSTADFFQEVVGVSSNSVEVRWLRVIVSSKGCGMAAYGFNGIIVHGSTDVEIRSNRIIGTNPNGSCGLADGIIFADGATGRAAFNVVRDFADTGIYVVNGSSARLFGNSIRVFADSFCATATETACTAGLTPSNRSGIRVVGSSAKVRRNAISVSSSVSDGTFAAGIRVDDADSGAGHTVRVTRNTVDGVGDGIQATSSNQLVMRFNTVKNGDRDGIGLFAGVTNSVVVGNNVHGQGGIGMRADNGTSGNQITDNDFSGNGSTDCVDNTGDAVPANTALLAAGPAAVTLITNTWARDVGNESDPIGLCTPAP